MSKSTSKKTKVSAIDVTGLDEFFKEAQKNMIAQMKDARVAELKNQLRWISTNEQLPIKRKHIYMIAIEGKYITDQYAGRYFGNNKWSRWPHSFPPTHWVYQIPNPEIKDE